MKKINDISIRIILPTIIGVVTFVILATVTIILTVNLRHNELKNTSGIARLKAQETGAQLAEVVNNAGSVVRAYSGVVEDLAASAIIPAEKKRMSIMHQMEKLILKEERLTNIWCCMEPNVLDGLDTLYAGQPGNTYTGAFAPWYIRKGNTAQLMRFEDVYSKEYYKVPKQTMKEMITEPYRDENGEDKLLLFSIAIPVMNGNRCIGVIGTDFDITDMKQFVENTAGGISTGRLVSGKGTVVVDRDLNLIGSPAEKDLDILARLSSGRTFEGMYDIDGNEVYKVYVPILLGKDNAPWYYAVDVPGDEIYRDANHVARLLLGANLVALVIIISLVQIIVRILLKGVTGITGIIHQLSFGIIDIRVNRISGKNEMGQMNAELVCLLDGLKRTAGFAKAIGDGMLDAGFQPLSEQDVLGNSLLDMRRSLQKAKIDEEVRKTEEEQRNWITSGLARFSEILRHNNDNPEALSYHIISNLVKYMNINQGGIFILNDETGFLELNACFAYDRRKFVEKKILPGEGLVGTCYREGETIYMTDLPEGYISITSGLGDHTPRALLIIPLKVNGEIYGIMEIASFTAFAPYQREFAERVSENIAATIASVRVSLRTNNLLMQTKLQAEEMSNVEEELRQNMEEMQTTQEEMKRREAELQQTLQNMEELQSNSQDRDYQMQQFYNSVIESFNLAVFTPDAVFKDINQKLISYLEGPSREDVIGQPLASIIGEEKVKEIWNSINAGNHFEYVQPIVNGAGKTVVFNQKFTPVFDSKGKLQHIIMVAYPLNQDK